MRNRDGDAIGRPPASHDRSTGRRDVTIVETDSRRTRPGSYGITVSGLADVFGINTRRVSKMLDRLPDEKKSQLDVFGKERVVPVWLARELWPNTFRDWPDAPGPVDLRAAS
jgi:hypothetical protein